MEVLFLKVQLVELINMFYYIGPSRHYCLCGASHTFGDCM